LRLENPIIIETDGEDEDVHEERDEDHYGSGSSDSAGDNDSSGDDGGDGEIVTGSHDRTNDSHYGNGDDGPKTDNRMDGDCLHSNCSNVPLATQRGDVRDEAERLAADTLATETTEATESGLQGSEQLNQQQGQQRVSSTGERDDDELGSPTEPATPCICVGGQSVCQHRVIDQYSSAGSLADENDTNRGCGNSAEPIRDDSSQPSVSTEAPRPAQPLKAPSHASPELSPQAQSVNAQQKQSHMAPGPSSSVPDKPRQTSAEPSLQPNASSRKRVCASVEDSPPRKRKRVETRKASR
jgi:hypothetical protein